MDGNLKFHTIIAVFVYFQPDRPDIGLGPGMGRLTWRGLWHGLQVRA